MGAGVRGSKWERDCWAVVLGFCRKANCAAGGERELSKGGICGVAS